MATLYTEADLNNIILRCSDEKEYAKPSIMIDNITNKKLYAYVTLIMLGDKYIAGAIVLAQSLRNLDTESDLVVMITPDVSEDGRRVLSQYFDRIIHVDYVNIPNWRTKKQQYKRYLELVFTKFHVFNLIEYKKVIMIDADALVLKHPDHLFTLNAPAGCILEDKDLFISYDANGNYVLPSDGKIKWYQKYCDCCSHGKLIPKSITDKIGVDQRNSGIGGGLWLLEPKKGEYEAILKDVQYGRMKFLVENRFVWPEQQYLALRYSGKWHSINPRFFGLQGYPHWSVLFGLQFGGDKPFILNSKIEMSVRIHYPDYILWHQIYANMLKDNPYLKTSSALSECNEMHKYFSMPLARYKPHSDNRYNHINPKKIQYLLDLKFPPQTNLEYYFLDQRTTYRCYKLQPMFSNIKPYDYFAPIKELANVYGNMKKNYYQTLYDKKIIVNDRLDKILLNTTIDIEDLDNIMLQYVKSRPSTFMITLWPIASKNDIAAALLDELQKHGNIYYLRKFDIQWKCLKNLMFWMYDEFSFNDRLSFIEKKLDYVEANKYTDNQITILIFDNIKNVNISGQASEFKRHLRNIVMNMVQKDGIKEGLRGNDLIHINDHFYQTVQYCELLLNNNSLNMLAKQNILLDGYMDRNEVAAHLKLQTFRKWLDMNISPLDLSKIIVIGGADMYAMGIRPLTDIDSILVKPNNVELEQQMYDTFQNKKTKFRFADMGVEGKFWQESWTQKNNDVYKYFNIDSIDEIVVNPRYHFYFQGLKFYLFDYEIVRKLYRAGEQDYADFAMILLSQPEIVQNFMTISDNNKMVLKDPEFIMKPMTDEFIDLIYNVIQKKYNFKRYPFVINKKLLHNFLNK